MVSLVPPSSRLAATEWPDFDFLTELSDHQRAQAKNLRSKVGLLIGTPGTGKTYTSAAIIKALVQEHGASNIGVCAPTGKAAVRLTAGLNRYGIGLDATTIHRLLRVSRNGHDKKGWGFEYGPRNRHPARFLVCDESSMLSTSLANSLLSAAATDAHILLIGDPYQLPPIDHGAPLRDMLVAGIPRGELTEIHRNAGMIVKGCLDLKNGLRFAALSSLDEIDEKSGRNLVHLEQSRPDYAMATLERTILQAKGAGFDPIWDVQVLCAINGNKSGVARDVLNQRLQALLNPDGQGNGKSQFRVGDKVICTANSWMGLVAPMKSDDIDWDEITRQETHSFPRSKIGLDNRVFIANGDIGRVVSITEKEVTIRFDFPERIVKTFANTGDVTLAYAITTHKAQGSQAPIVITMADGSFGAGMVCSREWWYTALSRAERIAITIGQRAVINQQCQKVQLWNRKTFLRESINEIWTPGAMVSA